MVGMLGNILSYIDKKDRGKSRPWHNFKLKVRKELSHLEWQGEEEIPYFPGHILLKGPMPLPSLAYVHSTKMIFWASLQ